MSLLLKQLFGLIKLLNSETGHNQIAAGIAAGLVLGMSPLLSLQAFLVFLFIAIFRVQAGAAFVAAFFFAFLHWLGDPLFDMIGRDLLESESLARLWTTLYNLPLVPLTRFNNSVVLGAGVVTLLLGPVIFFAARALIVRYRQVVVARMSQSKLWRAVKATSLYNWYYTYEKFRG